MFKFENIKMKKKWYYFALILTGGIAGYMYWYFIGCTSGSCPLKQNWYFNVFVGLFGGYVLADAIKDYITKRNKPKTSEVE